MRNRCSVTLLLYCMYCSIYTIFAYVCTYVIYVWQFYSFDSWSETDSIIRKKSTPKKFVSNVYGGGLLMKPMISEAALLLFERSHGKCSADEI